MMKTAISVCAMVFGIALPASAALAQAAGEWHAAFAAQLSAGSHYVELEFDQLPGGSVGQGHYAAFAEAGAACPTSQIRQEYCDELALFAARNTGDVTVLGVRFLEGTALMAFSHGNERIVRIAELRRNEGTVVLTVVHPERGIDVDAIATRRDHSCTFSMCAADRLDDLRGDPGRFAGPLARADFVAGYPTLVAARAGGGLENPVRQPDWTLDDPARWTVSGHDDGAALGYLDLARQGSGYAGGGQLDSIAFGPLSAVSVEPGEQLGDGFSLALGFMADGSGERSDAVLLLTPAGDGGLEGTLVEGTNVRVVRLRIDDTFDPEGSANDMPGIGVWGPSYILRNVPEGQRLVLREAPDRNAGRAGTLPRNAADIVVLNCTPEVDTMAFEDAGQQQRRALLDPVWCEVEWQDEAGFVPGTYLDPVAAR